MMVFSPVDSLKREMLKVEGVSVPAAKYSFVWSGQNAIEDMIPVCERFSGGKEELVDRGEWRGRVLRPFNPSFAFFEGVV